MPVLHSQNKLWPGWLYGLHNPNCLYNMFCSAETTLKGGKDHDFFLNLNTMNKGLNGVLLYIFLHSSRGSFVIYGYII